MTENKNKPQMIFESPHKRERKHTPPNSASNTINLHPWQEIIGQCMGFYIENENLAIHLFVNGQQTVIKVPKHQKAAALKVGSSLVGHKMGILKTDDPAENLIFRIVEKRTVCNEDAGICRSCG